MVLVFKTSCCFLVVFMPYVELCLCPAQGWLLWHLPMVVINQGWDWQSLEPPWQAALNQDSQICSVIGPLFKAFVFLHVPSFMSVFPSFWNSLSFPK